VTIDYLRSQPEQPLLGDEILETIPNRDPSPDILIELEEQKLLLEKMKKDLTPREQFFMRLCFERDLPPAIIASILHISENNIYQLKNRVKEKLKKMVDEYRKNLKEGTS